MDKRSIVLAALAPAMGGSYSPVQIQKLLFLIDSEIPKLVEGPVFDFQPYDYGPFDKSVYETLEQLTGEGLVEVTSRSRYRSYRLTDKGQQEGATILASMDRRGSNYIKQVSKFVRSLSFEDLVSAIYKAYPGMKVNSVFKG
jgi:uncharacterized protein YwgA